MYAIAEDDGGDKEEAEEEELHNKADNNDHFAGMDGSAVFAGHDSWTYGMKEYVSKIQALRPFFEVGTELAAIQEGLERNDITQSPALFGSASNSNEEVKRRSG